MKFPNVKGTNLHNERFNLPGDLEGTLNVLNIAFTQWQQPLVDTWVQPLERISQEHPNIAFYEIPTIFPMNWFRRRWLDAVMRAGIQDDIVCARTITIYVDIPTFLQQTSLPNQHNIYTLLVDRAGSIYWGTSGEYRPEHGAALQRAIQNQL